MKVNALIFLFLAIMVPAANADLNNSVEPLVSLTWPPDSPVFTLDLEHIAINSEQAFRIFPELLATDHAPLLDSALIEDDLSMALVFTAYAYGVPEHMRISLKPRTWDELDGWEKAGTVLGKASAVAGAFYILHRIID